MNLSALPPIPYSDPPRAAYIHVPFCAHRCGYCDFTLVAGRDDLIGDFLRMLEREIEMAEIDDEVPVDTIFFGGGTPTHPAPRELETLFEIVSKKFRLVTGGELSVEANPLDLSDERLDVLTSAGVNRISLGVQSFSANALMLLERDHRPADIQNVVKRLRPRFDNISFDLIFGVPGQSTWEWRETLKQAIELQPKHISTYGLTFESGTDFWNRRKRGELHSIDDEIEREQYSVAMNLLGEAGFVHYEISNFARPGYECRHNHVYWNGDSYWAFGPGAARYVHGRRETNVRSVLGWLAKLEKNESPVSESEQLDPIHRAKELVYLGLRRIAGINRADFHRRTGLDLDLTFPGEIDRQKRLGFLEVDDMGIRLTREGRFVADRVIMEFL